MAEGWARASGRPGVCTVTQGPGLTQLGTALTVATRARIPLVVFAGDTALGDHDSVQQLDQQKFVDATGAGFVPLWTAQGADEAVRQAFYQARVESRPVIVTGPGAPKAGGGYALRQLGDRIGALLARTLPMKGWLGESEYHVGVSGL